MNKALNTLLLLVLLGAATSCNDYEAKIQELQAENAALSKQLEAANTKLDEQIKRTKYALDEADVAKRRTESILKNCKK